MAKKQLPKEANFIANFLAKFDNSYMLLGYTNKSLLHRFVGDLLDIKVGSFKQLRDEYDGFYDHGKNGRKGYKNPEKRKSRVSFKEEFDNLSVNEYTEKVISILNRSEISILSEDELIEVDELFEEGKVNKIYINKYERNLKARNKSLEIHNNTCVVCGYKAFEKYGKNIFILEVHHIKLLSEIQKNYIVKPETDLKPLCPNCHRAIHSKNPPYTIDELQQLLKK